MSKARKTPPQGQVVAAREDQAVAGGVPPKPVRAPDEPVVVGVTGEGSTGRIQLGGGAASESMDWGEVRTAKQLERRLRQRAKVMERRADDARAMADRARQVAGHCGQLAEAARALDIKGSVQSELNRLAEAAGQQAAAAAQIEERCQRGAEASKVLLGNVERRDGPVYRAVVDSGLIRPEDRQYYMDGDAPHGADARRAAQGAA
jgi:hypothetical protein